MAQATRNISHLSAALNRGDVDGALKAVGLPRRSFLAGLAAMVPATAGASAAAEAPAADAKLLALQIKLQDAYARFKVASARNMAAFEEFERIQPEKPKALLWRAGDPVRPCTPEVVNGRSYRWLSFTGLKQLSESGQTFPDRHMQSRADQLREAYRSYAAAQDKALQHSGHSAAEAASNAALRELERIYEQMLEIKPTTLEGVRALATGVLLGVWLGVIDVPDKDHADRGLAAIVSAMTNIPIGGTACAHLS